MKLHSIAINNLNSLLAIFNCKEENPANLFKKPVSQYSVAVFDSIGKFKSDITISLVNPERHTIFDTHKLISVISLPRASILAVILDYDTIDLIGMTIRHRLHHLRRLTFDKFTTVKRVRHSDRRHAIVMLHRDSMSIVDIVC